MSQSSELSVLGDRHPYKGPKHALLAHEFREQLQQMKREIALRGVALPGDRFDETDAELFRFANAFGLAEGRPRAVRLGAEMCCDAVRWRASYPFLHRDPEQLRPWRQYVRWHGKDTSGRPVLWVMLARAVGDHILPRDKRGDPYPVRCGGAPNSRPRGAQNC